MSKNLFKAVLESQEDFVVSGAQMALVLIMLIPHLLLAHLRRRAHPNRSFYRKENKRSFL